MKLYLALAVLTTAYIMALTLGATEEPRSLLWNGIVGFMLSTSLVLSVVPVAGPLLYETASQILYSSLNPPLHLTHLLWLLRLASWAINLAFTSALVLYVLQIKRAKARRIIRALLF